jgi:hypothetical protein
VTNNPQTLSLARREQPTAALRTVQRERRFLGGQQHHHAGRTAVPPRHHRQRRSDGHCRGLLALAECCPQYSPDRWWIDSASSGQACSPTLPQARQWQPCRCSTEPAPPVLAAPCPGLPFVQHQYARRLSPFRFDTCPCPSGGHGYRTRQRRGSSHPSPGPDRVSAAGRRTDHSAGCGQRTFSRRL